MERVEVNVLNQREELFEKVSKSGLLWSYSKDIEFENIPEKIYIEHTLKYADIPELFILFSLYKIDYLKQIWEERIAHDPSLI